MLDHLFLFKPGRWVGAGRITFSGSPEFIRFYTSWTIDPVDEREISGWQRVEMQGGDDFLSNHFLFHTFEANHFKVELENSLFGKVQGGGIIDAKTIAWEFRGNNVVEGFEIYEKQENDDYMLHAEYVSTDFFRSTIDGRIWYKSEE